MTVRIYVEGGGDNDSLGSACRRGFSEFLRKAGFGGRMPRIVSCGSRRQAYEDFGVALARAKPDEFPILLVDAEDAVDTRHGPWEHLRQRPGDQWEKPDGASDEHAHLMVQCMETWFIADRDALARFFGAGFRA